MSVSFLGCKLTFRRISDILVSITKKPIPEHQRALILEIQVDDQSDAEEVEVPYVMVKLK